LAQTAVFATVLSPLPHAAAFGNVHFRPAGCFNIRRAFA
jgi:hypothetical protein